MNWEIIHPRNVNARSARQEACRQNTTRLAVRYKVDAKPQMICSSYFTTPPRLEDGLQSAVCNNYSLEPAEILNSAGSAPPRAPLQSDANFSPSIAGKIREH